MLTGPRLLFGLGLLVLGLAVPALAHETQPAAPVAGQPASPFPQASTVLEGLNEIRVAFVRLPLAALFGTALAFRPRRRAQGARKVVVIQTQIMLAVVGAVIMLVVGNSLSRAFGIVGAAGLIRYRSNIADPKDAVVMLCALASGLAVGVGLYQLGAVATMFMMLLLWIIEFLEPAARRRFELRIETTDPEFRFKAEDVLKGLGLEFELLLEDEDEIRYSISAPVDVRTRDVSDTLRLVSGGKIVVRWEEKRNGV
ncbi:MAG TPA: MgtC/SapB family protein [Vicinamibacterales bacterium]|nr:MgtC/SapB family protein [Vicinamibacterales bacterium]